MNKKSNGICDQSCDYLFIKDGKPLCLFRVAEPQPCGYSKGAACYYRGGPFVPGDTKPPGCQPLKNE